MQVITDKFALVVRLMCVLKRIDCYTSSRTSKMSAHTVFLLSKITDKTIVAALSLTVTVASVARFFCATVPCIMPSYYDCD